MVTEKQIEDKFVKWVKSVGGEALKLRVDGKNGFPDRTVLLDGKVYFVEFKKPGGIPSHAQIEWRETLVNLGFTAIITDNLDFAKWVAGDEY